MDRGETGRFWGSKRQKVDSPSRLNVGTLEKCVGDLKGMEVNAS